MKRVKSLLLLALFAALVAFVLYDVGLWNKSLPRKNANSGVEVGSGVKGQVMLGPQCPYAQDKSGCGQKPYSTTLDVLDLKGAYIKSFSTDAVGNFSVSLPPGEYAIRSKDMNTLPNCGKEGIFPVNPSQYTEVVVNCDTGIR